MIRYVIVGVLALLIGGGLEMERNRIHYRVELGIAYGCGRAAARNVYYPSKDPLDNEEQPRCVEYRKTWEKW
jgi:hypothetical protein